MRQPHLEQAPEDRAENRNGHEGARAFGVPRHGSQHPEELPDPEHPQGGSGEADGRRRRTGLHHGRGKSGKDQRGTQGKHAHDRGRHQK